MPAQKSKTSQIFLCHASEDKASVLEIYKRFKDAGLNPWLDKKDLLPGQAWAREIPKALKKSDFVLIFFSTTSVAKRGFVQKEFKLALDVLDEIPEGQIFIIPVRLDDCQIPDTFLHLHYCDLFEDDGLEQILRAIKAEQGIIESDIVKTIEPPILLRSQPLDIFSKEAAKEMLVENDFFDDRDNKDGKGLEHQYKKAIIGEGKVVVDHKTGLTWQRGGSSEVNLKGALAYVQKLKEKKYAGFSDWRLPTLEEAMSLMEPKMNEHELHIDPIFDKRQGWIWTADRVERTQFFRVVDGKASVDASGVWAVYFVYGYCYDVNVHYGYYNHVRAVR